MARLRSPCAVFGVAVAWMACGAARAQSVEPRAYSPAPVGVNFVVAGFTDSRGGLPTDGSIPLQDPKIEIRGPLFAYARTFGLAGRSAKIDFIAPMGRLSGSAVYQGLPAERRVTGFADPLVRVSISLLGAPALDAEQFRSYRQDLVVGASLQVSAPLGQYDGARLINLGANRWFFKPELGLAKSIDAWVLELAGGATFYTANNAFFGGHRRAQRPIYSARVNAIYNFRAGMWASLDATYFSGGETRLDDGAEDSLQRNWRIGSTLTFPVTRRTSLKFNASRGVSARTGNNYDLLGVACQYRWGGGL